MQVPRKDNQFLLHMWHTTSYSCYKSGDTSCMRIAPEDICDHLWHRCFVTVNHVMVATAKFSQWLLQLYHKEHCPLGYLLAASFYQGNHDRNFKLWTTDQLWDIYSLCRFCWIVATYKWRVHTGILSFVVKVRS